jgi:hypothetical protein
MAFEVLSEAAFQASHVPFPPTTSSAVFNGVLEDNLLESFFVPRIASTLSLSYVCSLTVCTLRIDILRCISIPAVGFSRPKTGLFREVEHWGDRLMKLKRAYDGHKPEGPLQRWRDDRKSEQWWTFWIAA